jgi:hypothetical protein
MAELLPQEFLVLDHALGVLGQKLPRLRKDHAPGRSFKTGQAKRCSMSAIWRLTAEGAMLM